MEIPLKVRFLDGLMSEKVSKDLKQGRPRDNFHESLWHMPLRRVASSAVEHPAFNRLVLSSNLRRPTPNYFLWLIDLDFMMIQI